MKSEKAITMAIGFVFALLAVVGCASASDSMYLSTLTINETAGIARFNENMPDFSDLRLLGLNGVSMPIRFTVDNPNPPTSPAKLIFIHHSCGENGLADYNGRLGIALRDNNYFVSDTNYGWGPDSIGDCTDIGHWWTWFCGSHNTAYTNAIYTEYYQHSTYSRLPTDPGGDNEIIMFKSCFPNSYLRGNPDDPPTTDDNPLRGQECWSEHHTAANVKGIYNDLLAYFATRQDKLFIVITAPPLVEHDTDATHAANARAFNNWLINDWLIGYPYNNVAVFDFYNVLTSNGDDVNTNDAGWKTGNHHRWWNGAVQHIQTVSNNFAAYGSDPWDSHPTAAGNQKATEEFVPLLNVFYHRWKGYTTPDTTPPAAITDLSVSNPTKNSIKLSWTAPGDDGNVGTASTYDIRYSTSIITEANWDSATQVIGEPSPSAPGTPQSMTVTGLNPSTTFYFAIETSDEVPNMSNLSNIARETTLSSPPPTRLDVTLVVTNTLNVSCFNEPVTSGVPIPRDVNLIDLSPLRLLDGNSQPVPAQLTPLARWGGAPDDASKPVRWLLLDFQSNVPANGTASYRLVDSGGAMPTFPTLTVTDGANAVTVNTGAAQFSISKTNGRLIAPHLAAPLFGRAVDADGTVYTTTGPVTVTVALEGPMRASTHVKGTYRDAGGTALLNYTSRYWFYAGQSYVHLFHTVENNNLCPLVEHEQLDCYDIGSGCSVNITDLSLIVQTNISVPINYYVGGEGETINGTLSDELVLYQDSSGTDHWDCYPNLTDWYGNPLDTRPRMQSYVSFRGYRTSLGGTNIGSGNHAQGWMCISNADSSWSVAVRDFWQNFPKALRATPTGTLEIGLFPDEFGPVGYNFNLRAGEHKTHEILLYPHDTGGVPAHVRAFSDPLFARAPAEWYVNSGAFGLTAVQNVVDWPDHEHYVDYQLVTSPNYEEWMDWYPNLLVALENTDFYGMFDYGDWPIDYEGYGVAPLNCKYDNDYGMWLQWARGSDPRWFELAEAADRHFADVDILHNLHSPRHWGDGIAFGHSYHDEAGFTNPHRNYGGSHPDTAFGLTGMLLTYYLTGYEKTYESALELADCIEYRVHNDEHLCDFFPPGECNDMGYALGDGMYDAGCRPAANCLSIVVAAYRATADPRYLAVADAVVDWAGASDQPYINGPTGEDQMMRPWMLNMYLRALAGYLEMRDEFGLPDTYDAQTSYLAYTNWLRTYALLDLTPIDTDPRAAYPYEWWFDGRTGIPGDDNDNNDPSICNWLLLGADSMAYAYHINGVDDYLEYATRLFRTGSRDPWYEGDLLFYSESKQTVNSITLGHIFLHEWARKKPRSTSIRTRCD
ncbi:hypothetical protein C5S32_06375 [ANME-1 cluster archaeon GoMg1]|nr:hypothetical protein [ANME-1 cluster archaeon GoMg1]